MPPSSPLILMSQALTRIQHAVPPENREITWEFRKCPRCEDHLFSVRAKAPHILLMRFCKRCFWFEVTGANHPAITLHPADTRGQAPRQADASTALDKHIKKALHSLRAIAPDE